MKKRLSKYMTGLLLIALLLGLTVQALADYPYSTELNFTVGEPVSIKLADVADDFFNEVETFVQAWSSNANLPEGLELRIEDSATAEGGRIVLVGTPTKAGNNVVAVTFIGAKPSGEGRTYNLEFSMTISAGGSGGSSYDVEMTVDNATDYALALYGSKAELTSGALPKGISYKFIDSKLYFLGEPEKAGTYTVVFTMEDGDTVTFTITVEPPLEIVIKKSPTGETISEGGSATFVAKAENADACTWTIVDTDGEEYPITNAPNEFPGLEVSGIGKEKPTEDKPPVLSSTLKLKNIPFEMDGCKIYCTFFNETSTKDSAAAELTIDQGLLPEPEIVTQPQGGAFEIDNDRTLYVTAKAERGNLFYEWYCAPTASYSAGKMVSSGSSSCVPAFEAGKTVYYYCVVWAEDDTGISDMTYSDIVALNFGEQSEIADPVTTEEPDEPSSDDPQPSDPGTNEPQSTPEVQEPEKNRDQESGFSGKTLKVIAIVLAVLFVGLAAGIIVILKRRLGK